MGCRKMAVETTGKILFSYEGLDYSLKAVQYFQNFISTGSLTFFTHAQEPTHDHPIV